MRHPLPARVASAPPDGRLALLVCPGVEGYGTGIRIEMPAELAPAEARAVGSDLLVGWDRPGEDAPVAWAIRLPCYELDVRLPGPFAERDYPPLIDRVVPALGATLVRHRLGTEPGSYTAGPGSGESAWECRVHVNDLRTAVAVLRRALIDLGVQPDATINVCPNDLPFRVVRSYPLVAPEEGEDWSDLAEVERAARWPSDMAIGMQVPCW